MNDRWEPMISASLAIKAPPCAPILLRGPLSMTVDMAAEIGFSGIELHFGTVDEIDWGLLDGRLKDRDLRLTSIGTGRIFTVDGLSISDADVCVAEAAEARLISMIDKVAGYGPEIIIGSVKGRLSADPAGREKAYSRLVLSLGRLARYAGEKGCRLAVEAINSTESDNINTTDELIRLIDDVGSAFVRAHLDSYHMLAEKEDIARSVKRAGARIGHVHLADSKRMAPGLGTINFKEFLEELKHIGYKGVLAFEYPPDEKGSQAEEDPDKKKQARFAKVGLDYIKGCLKGL